MSTKQEKGLKMANKTSKMYTNLQIMVKGKADVMVCRHRLLKAFYVGFFS